jgi:hypothetical protein
MVGFRKRGGNARWTRTGPIQWFVAILYAVAMQSAPTQAWVLPSSLVIDSNNDLGTCTLEIKANQNSIQAWIFISGPSYGRMSGGAYWAGTIDTGYATPTNADLAANCGLSAVTISSNIGASGTYATQTLMELVLQATEDADGMTYDYVYRLSGAAGSAPVLTRTKNLAVLGPSAQESQDANADFSQRQANNILSTTPSITGFLSGGTGIASRDFYLNANDGGYNLRFNGSLLTRGSSKNYAGKTDIWASVLATRSEATTTSGEFVIGYLGAHKFIRENLLVGGMVQFDYGMETESTAGSTGTGRGFMLGPYIAGEVGTSGLRFEGQARWGRSFNTISPIGTYTDGYSTTRWMAQARLEGSLGRGDWTISPNINLSYFNEVQEAYTDGLANAIAAQTITLGEVKLGPDFSHAGTLPNGNPLQTRFGVAAVSNFAVSTTAGAQSFALGAGQVRGRLDFGISTTTGNGWGLAASAFYDGIGIGSYQSYGGTIKAEIKF